MSNSASIEWPNLVQQFTPVIAPRFSFFIEEFLVGSYDISALYRALYVTL